jgi:hypothetical protein
LPSRIQGGPAREEVVALTGVVGERDRGVAGGLGLVVSTQSCELVSAGGPGWLEPPGLIGGDVEQRQPGGWPLNLCGDGGQRCRASQ